ncbi:hypothetical protein HMPREF3119_04210 [Morganella sp. HMSC11D09]|uniref:acyltransferase n=1 Tax=Morganella sp. HMSC11D09 TaxID=1581087 RepID=UPI0008A5E0F2|nr:acyltransferase family protein [Morganella sp. HMSC11D09]OFV02208.1 hypothetical protein HMPREF3119_04210 [Morganella sp. HMSC11D09]
MKENVKIDYIDSIRAFGAVAVVLIHVSGYYVSMLSNGYGVSWNFANIVDSMSRVAVPLFYMISGFIFFNNKEPKLKNFIKIPIIIVFYSLVSIFIIKLLTIYMGTSPYPIYLNLLKTPSYYHLWFLYPLIGIYIISSLVKIREKDSIRALLIIALIFVFFNKNTASLIFTALGINSYFYFMLDGDFIFYLLYAISGAYIKHIKVKNSYLSLSVLMYVVSIALISIPTSIISQSENKIIEVSYNFNSPLVFFSAVSVFIILKSIKVKNKITNLLSSRSLAIYGFHAPLLLVIQSIFPYSDINSLVGIPLISITLIIVCLALSEVTRFFDRWRIVS